MSDRSDADARAMPDEAYMALLAALEAGSLKGRGVADLGREAVRRLEAAGWDPLAAAQAAAGLPLYCDQRFGLWRDVAADSAIKRAALVLADALAASGDSGAFTTNDEELLAMTAPGAVHHGGPSVTLEAYLRALAEKLHDEPPPRAVSLKTFMIGHVRETVRRRSGLSAADFDCAVARRSATRSAAPNATTATICSIILGKPVTPNDVAQRSKA